MLLQARRADPVDADLAEQVGPQLAGPAMTMQAIHSEAIQHLGALFAAEALEVLEGAEVDVRVLYQV